MGKPVLCLAVMLFASGWSTAKDALETARRSFDMKALEAVHETILKEAGEAPQDAARQLRAAEGYRLLANHWRHRRHILELPSKEEKDAEARQVALAKAGLPFAEAALRLADTDAARAQANRCAGELHAYQITGMVSGMRNGPKAKRYCDEAIRLAPTDAECRRAIGEMYLYNPPMNGGDAEKAVETFSALSGDAADSDVYPVLLAMAYRKKGDIPMARKAAHTALSRNPRNEDASLLVKVLQ